MIIKFVMKFLPTCLPSRLTVAAPDAFGRIPGVRLDTWISEIGYLSLPSRYMAEIPLKRRKSSIQPTNNTSGHK